MYIRRLLKRQVSITVATIAVLAVFVLGSSYAVIQKTFTDDNVQTLNVGNLSVAFSNNEGGELQSNNSINLDMQPMSDEYATNANYTRNLYTFVVNNTGSVAYKYTIKLEDDENYTENLLSHEYLRYQLNDGEINFLSNTTNGVIYNYTVNPGENQNFKLKIWVADADVYEVPNDVMGQEIHLKIIIDGEASFVRGPEGWNTSEADTLLARIKNTNQEVDSATTKTIPGQEIATANEGLRSAEDDYGTSYYYRGAVENNYVVFAKMCWRIVRIDGQGNIKLVLYNYNSDKTNVTNPCNVTGGNLAFARYDGDTYQGAFNTSYNKNTYVGYMYSNTPDSNNYLEAHANDKDSIILSRLKTWYDSNFNNTQKNLLADTIWCNDKRLADKEYQAGPDTEINYLNTGIGAQKTGYAAIQRLVSDTGENWTAKADATPTLKCGRTMEDNKISKFTAQDTTYGNAKLYTTEGGTTKYYKIGLLTADEIAYAGGIAYQNNTSYYLNKNANSNWWWSLSPFRFGGSGAVVFFVNAYGGLGNGNVYGTGGAVRPAVSLTSTTRIASGGNGTATNPFVIVES